MQSMADLHADHPKWSGINLNTAENLRFASTSKLFQLYLSCLNSPVSATILHSWLMGSYQGSLSACGMPDGEGSAKLFGGLDYTGTFKGGLLHGYGTLSKCNSWSYSGTFSYNNIHGNGVYTWPHGSFYKGQVPVVHSSLIHLKVVIYEVIPLKLVVKFETQF